MGEPRASRLSEGGELLHTQTLDDLLGDYPSFPDPDVIKIDTDGFDPAIFVAQRRLLEP